MEVNNQFADIVFKANHPHLKTPFDNGHALVFSQIPAKGWIEHLGLSLFHYHLHDNSGEIDEHEVIGTGRELLESGVSSYILAAHFEGSVV